MKILSSEIKDYEGSIENVGGITLGYLEQIHFRDETISIRDTLRDSFEEIRTLEKEIEEEELLMSETGEFEKYTELIERFKLIGGYTYENEVERVSR